MVTVAEVPTVAEVTAVMDRLYPPGLAESWDAVGLVCGDPDARAGRVYFCVDVTAATVDEALDWGADLIVAHHPLLLRAVNSVAATTYKGRLLHRLIRAEAALLVAHTNADAADPGVSDALAVRLGLRDLRPLRPAPADPLDKLVAFVPLPDVDKVIDAATDAGAGARGTDYSRWAWTTPGVGTFVPAAGASPAVGVVGIPAQVPEARVELIVPRHRRDRVVEAVLAAHPYEQPAYDVFELAALPGTRGIGRVGELSAPTTLAGFLAHVAAVLPPTAAGLRSTGDPDQVVRHVAVSGGAGDGFLAEVRRLGVDAFLTADLRHHPASEHTEAGGPALVDAAHWATERPWLDQAAALLSAGLAPATVDTLVSDLPTDAWTLHAPSARR
ncbi:MAG TPA: Nif3-like dinuclear metal center hexameric protein [Cryptosporangiaceae bacterium]|nr:Nif3-like dinuclear metal center hexameric protein [Cryptosporangiaceae bacterium]